MMLFVDECDAKAHFSGCQIVVRREKLGGNTKENPPLAEYRALCRYRFHLYSLIRLALKFYCLRLG